MKKHLSLKEKLGFSIGEYSASIVWQTLMFFLPVFYTDTFGLSAATAGTMFFVIRLFDAFNDPIMGSIADNTRTKWGQFRPYLLWMAVPYGFAAVLMFSVPELDSLGKTIYAYCTYAFMMIIYTMIMIPYNAMVGIITPNPDERTVVSSYKFVFAYAAGMTVQGAVIPLVAKLGNGNDILGYRYTMIIFGGICILCFLISFLTTKERVSIPSTQKRDTKTDFKNLFSNKPWIIVFVVALLMLIYIAIRSSVIIYFFDYFLLDKEQATIFMLTGTIAVLLGVIPTKWLTSMLGKKKLFMVCMFIIAVSSFGLYFAGNNLLALYFFQIVFSFASGPTMPLIWSMLADTSDYGEWKFSRRNTGLIYSAATMGQKTGFSLGGAFALWILAFFGYMANQEQSTEAILGIRLSLSIIPGIIAILCTLILYFYPLDESTVQTVSKELQTRKG